MFSNLTSVKEIRIITSISKSTKTMLASLIKLMVIRANSNYKDISRKVSK